MTVLDFEHRVCRSTPDDTNFNTIDIYPGPTFGILEFLDTRDSRYFRRELLRRNWLDLTPDVEKSRQTYYHVRPSADELRAYRSIEPEWFYISGHYARTYDRGNGVTLAALPAGFFNEPFHVKEWKSAWGNTDPKSLLVQTEKLGDGESDRFKAYLRRRWLRSPYGPGGMADKTANPANRDDVVDEWLEIWKRPTDVLPVGATTTDTLRDLFFDHVWAATKVVLLVGCNTLAWRKDQFTRSFPNALILGYINKNPANGTPHIRAFLRNVFRGTSGRDDPKLMDHDHVAKAWMDVHARNRMRKSERMAYMTTGGEVFGAGQAHDTIRVGTSTQVMLRGSSGFEVADEAFGFSSGASGTEFDPPSP